MASILVVEHELDVGRLLTRELDAAGYGVRHAATGLRLFAECAADVLVLD